MKACFVLQRSYAFVGHSIAVTMKERYGLTDFCGCLDLRSSYNWLKNQPDLQYSDLLLFDEVFKQYKNEKLDLVYLRWLEKEYGIPNLWPFIAADRIIMHNQLVREYPYDAPPYTHDEMLCILQAAAKAILNFLEREKPDFILFSTIGGLGALLLYHMAKKKGIKTLVLFLNIIKDTSVISEDYKSVTGLEEILSRQKENIRQGILPQEAVRFLEEFRKRPHSYFPKADPKNQQVSRSKQLHFLKPKNLLRNFRWLRKLLYDHFTTNDRLDYSYIGPWNYLRDGIKRKLRNLRSMSDMYDTFDPTENYAFFPLQVEPELTLLVLAPFNSNQLGVIKNIARSLPVGYTLYVKEHPQMVMYRPRSYYRQLKKIPNVKLIHPAITGFEAMRDAKLVTTITGTAGWEAVLMKKPVITFGDIFYNQFSFVKYCRAFEDLPRLVKEQLERFAYNEEEMLAFLGTIFEFSAKNIDLPYLWEQETDPTKKRNGIEPLADLLARKLNLKNKSNSFDTMNRAR